MSPKKGPSHFFKKESEFKNKKGLKKPKKRLFPFRNGAN